MAGLLSKGITLGYKGKEAGIKYKHTISFVDDMGDSGSLKIVTETPDALEPVLITNPAVLIGAEMIEFNGEPLECVILGAFYDDDTSCVALSCSDDGAHKICLNESMTEETDVVYPTANSGETFVVLKNLQEIAELGNNAPEKIDVTVLSDDAKKSIDGLADTAQDLAFKFLYSRAQFAELAGLTGSYEWRVTLPDNTQATFTATPSVKLAGVGVSAALTYTLTLSVESEIVFA
jgi:hypothetical protein